MRTLLRLVPLVAAITAPLVASAQPSEPPPGGEGSGSATPSGDEDTRIKELVDRELARVLNDRAAKEAAERATHEPADAGISTSAGANGGEITGASGFMDPRLAFTLTNENVLVKPGETIPSVPGWRFGTPNSLGVLFFDNYDTRYSGFETLSHATMYREYTSGHLQAEGALVVQINDLSENNISLSDDGTYLTLTDWKDPSHKDPTRISLTAFPVSSDRFRLGYSYRLSWGGTPEYRRSNTATPGAKLQYDT